MFSDYKTDKQIISFKVKDVDLSIINAIRRIMLSEIPVVGFEPNSVTIQINTGPLHNEIMSHRIAMIPINYSEEETESFDPEKATVFSFHAKNTGQQKLNVTTTSFTIENQPAREIERLFPKTVLPDGSTSHLLITRLREGEELKLTAKPVKKTATVNAAFSPISVFATTFLPDPVLFPQAKTIIEKERAYIRNQYGEPIEFELFIEPIIGLGVPYLISKSLDILIQKVNTVLTEVQNSESSKVKINSTTNITEFIIELEDDTLGYALQSLMHNYYIRSKMEEGVEFVGYVCPHPHEQRVFVSIRSSDPIAKIISGCRHVIEIIRNVQDEWKAFTKY